MTTQSIRVGVIGAGENTRKKHLPGLLSQSQVEIVKVCNRTEESSAKVAEQFNIPDLATDWTEIIDDDQIDAVCIGTWPYLHAPITIAALEADKHVLCEARMAMNAQEAHAMLAVARTCPYLVAQIVPSPLTLKFDRTINEMIALGLIGELISVDARITVGSHFPQPDTPAHWRQDRTLSGNNIMTLGIWYESILRWLGPARTVQALGQNVVKHRLRADGRRLAMTIPDHIDVMGAMEIGGQMRLSISTVVGYMPSVEIYICGTEGTLKLHNASGELALEAGSRDSNGLEPVAIAASKQGHWRVEEEFINAIRGVEEVSHTDFATAVQYMEWTDAVGIAARSGRMLPLPLNLSEYGWVA